MARHSNGRRNFRLAPGLIALIVIIAVILALSAGWLALRRHNATVSETSQKECIEGPLEAPIYESTPGVAGALIDQWTQENPVVRDYCVHPTFVASPDQAAALVGLSNDDIDESLSQGKRSVSGTHIQTRLTLSLALKEGSQLPDDPATTLFPEPQAAAIALALSGGDQDEAAKLLNRDHDLSLDQVLQGQPPSLAVSPIPEGYHREALPYQVNSILVPLTATEKVNEEQTRAGAAFVEYAATHDQSQPNEVLNEAALAQLRSAQQMLPSADTLFLLDTSGRMNSEFDHQPAFEATRSAITDAAEQLGLQGKTVALMNYSSPLSPGVTKGWRVNSEFGSADKVKGDLALLHTGGVPQTRSAVMKALELAEQHHRDSRVATRVVVISTGTDEAIDDISFRKSIEDARQQGIDLRLIHLGVEPMDSVLSDYHPALPTSVVQLRQMVSHWVGVRI
ncbi:VWA domain-containing protein [Corynebacterium sp. 3HC-13]|uniref:vWA domain-containing protein n=1 Tax=Corynebacterium poyangense TaxID=2684405 RepID=UPI001CCB7E20|nr:vWA domain-containing protein [Corynebacterium poyangense]MBZ8177739.1 VWA domain-containing protein [Corynebacterium poyangense]